MEKKYWYDLKDEERASLINEWHSSDWCRNAAKEHKRKIPYFFAYHIYLIINVLLTIDFIGMGIYSIYIIYETETLWPLISVAVIGIPWGLCIDYINKIHTQIDEEFYEKEAIKWLLVHHNVIK